MSFTDLMTLFGKPVAEARWVANADSDEYLALVSFLIQRNFKEQRG